MTSPNKKALYRQRRLLALLIAVCVVAVGVLIALAVTSLHNRGGHSGDPSGSTPITDASFIPLASPGQPGETSSPDETQDANATEDASAVTEAPTEVPHIDYNAVAAHASATVSRHGLYTELLKNVDNVVARHVFVSADFDRPDVF